MFQLGWFSTGRDQAARDLLRVARAAIEKGEIKAYISFVFSNREPGESSESDLFFNLVKSYGIPLICFSYQKFRQKGGYGSATVGNTLAPWRLEYDRGVMRCLSGYQADLCVLAGYMLIVGAEMCQRYTMINLHPARPGGPSGTWQEVIWKLMEQQAKETGVMMHLVTPELDSGPPATYCTFPIRGGSFDEGWQELEGSSLAEIKRSQGEANSLFQLIRRHGVSRELPLVVTTIKAFSEGKVRVQGQKVVDASGEPIKGYDLTKEIDDIVRQRRIAP